MQKSFFNNYWLILGYYLLFYGSLIFANFMKAVGETPIKIYIIITYLVIPIVLWVKIISPSKDNYNDKRLFLQSFLLSIPLASGFRIGLFLMNHLDFGWKIVIWSIPFSVFVALGFACISLLIGVFINKLRRALN